MVTRPAAAMNPAHAAELEDRATSIVDRDALLCIERDDLAAGRAEQHEHDHATMEKRAMEWADIKDRSGHPSDYGWDFSWWRGVL